MIEPTERDREMAREVDDDFMRRGLGRLPAETVWRIGLAISRARSHADAAGYARGREEVARWIMGEGYATGHGDTISDLLVELRWQIREKAITHGKAEMRERAAMVADKWAKTKPDLQRSNNETATRLIASVCCNAGRSIASDIRALED